MRLAGPEAAGRRPRRRPRRSAGERGHGPRGPGRSRHRGGRDAARREPARARARAWRRRSPLAPWRTAREPFLEFGHGDDGGLGDSLLAMVLDGRKTVSVALAREWDLEGGPPRPGQRIPVLDASGTRRAIVEVVRVTVVPFADVDSDVVEASQAGVATVGRVARDAARVLRGLPRRGRAAARRARLAPHRRRADGRHLVHAASSRTRLSAQLRCSSRFHYFYFCFPFPLYVYACVDVSAACALDEAQRLLTGRCARSGRCFAPRLVERPLAAVSADETKRRVPRRRAGEVAWVVRVPARARRARGRPTARRYPRPDSASRRLSRHRGRRAPGCEQAAVGGGRAGPGLPRRVGKAPNRPSRAGDRRGGRRRGRRARGGAARRGGRSPTSAVAPIRVEARARRRRHHTITSSRALSCSTSVSASSVGVTAPCRR